MLPYQYAYLFGDLMLGILWLFLFLHRKDLRKELLVTSFIFGFCGPISELFYLRDYWHPDLVFGLRIGLEDFLFGFFIGGITSVIYKEVFHKHFSSQRDRTHHWVWFVPSFVFIGLVILGFLIKLGVGSIYASMFMFGIISLLILFYRRDLLLEALLSGATITGIIFVLYIVFLQIFPEIFQRWWMLSNISGKFLFRVPIEELWWAFSFGLMAGPLYDFVLGLKFKK